MQKLIDPAVGNPAVVVAPLVLDGVEYLIAGSALAAIGAYLGQTWDGVAETWNNLVSWVQNGIDNLLHADKWIPVTSDEGQTILTAVYDCYCADHEGEEEFFEHLHEIIDDIRLHIWSWT